MSLFDLSIDPAEQHNIASEQPDVVKRFTELGIDPVGSTPEAYAALNKSEYEKYGKLVKETGAKVD